MGLFSVETLDLPGSTLSENQQPGATGRRRPPGIGYRCPWTSPPPFPARPWSNLMQRWPISTGCSAPVLANT